MLDALAREIRGGWAARRGCAVRVAPDPATAMELLAAGAPGGAALAAWSDGDSPADDRGLACDGQAEGRFALALCVRPGLAPRDGAPGALREAESLRSFIFRAASGDGLLGGWRYSGMQSFQLQRGDPPAGGYTITLLGDYDAWEDEEEEGQED